MNENIESLSFEEAARRLSVEPRQIKQLLREHQLFTVKGPDGKDAIPTAIITRGEFGWEPLWNLPGTLTVLLDGGFTLEEAVSWLYSFADELDQTPLEALIAGRHHRVNTLAATLAF